MNSYFGAIIHDCKSLWTTLPTVEILFVHRSANFLAHFLAKKCSSADYVLYKDDLSSDCVAVLQADC